MTHDPTAPPEAVKPVILVGFVAAALATLARVQPADSVIWVEGPDAVRERRARDQVVRSPVVRELVEWRHDLPGKADEFYNLYQGLEPAAVIPLTEGATPFAARLAERYGLPGAGFGAAQILRDESQLRCVTRAAGIRQAWAESRVPDDGGSGPDRPAAHTPAECCVSGPEYSVETLVRAGRELFVHVTGKQLLPGPRPAEMAHVVPEDIAPELAGLLGGQTRRVIGAVGFRDGFVHCEWIVADGVPHLVGCAGRLVDDGVVELIEQAYPVELVRVYYAVMKGEPLPGLPREAKGGAAVRFPSMEPGVVADVRGVGARELARTAS